RARVPTPLPRVCRMKSARWGHRALSSRSIQDGPCGCIRSCHTFVGPSILPNARPAEMTTPFISLIGASFRLVDRLVFKNTSLEFKRDQHWAVVGPNGSGKSLFGDALRGRLPVVQGELRYYFKPP